MYLKINVNCHTYSVFVFNVIWKKMYVQCSMPKCLNMFSAYEYVLQFLCSCTFRSSNVTDSGVINPSYYSYVLFQQQHFIQQQQNRLSKGLSFLGITYLNSKKTECCTEEEIYLSRLYSISQPLAPFLNLMCSPKKGKALSTWLN